MLALHRTETGYRKARIPESWGFYNFTVNSENGYIQECPTTFTKLYWTDKAKKPTRTQQKKLKKKIKQLIEYGIPEEYSKVIAQFPFTTKEDFLSIYHDMKSAC